MTPRKTRIQFKEDSQWKTLCVWLERDRYGAELLLKRLKSRYEDARIIDYEEAKLEALETD